MYYALKIVKMTIKCYKILKKYKMKAYKISITWNKLYLLECIIIIEHPKNNAFFVELRTLIIIILLAYLIYILHFMYTHNSILDYELNYQLQQYIITMLFTERYLRSTNFLSSTIKHFIVVVSDMLTCYFRPISNLFMSINCTLTYRNTGI